MNDRKIKFAALIAALTVMTSGCKANAPNSSLSNVDASLDTSVKSIRTITLDEAKAAVLRHAGLNENDVVFVKVRLENDGGIAEYDIEFTADNTKYEYEIDAGDGKVLKFSSEVISENQTDVSFSSSSEASVQITLDEAKDIALKHAGIKSSETVFTKAKSDNDDGILKYDIEFTANNTEYEYEISAIDGSILESSAEAVNTMTSAPSAASSQITLDEAKAIALKQAGVTGSEAVFTKAKLDYDDGIAKYEIEFIANDTEYEYEIGANSGNILESSAEKIKRTVSTAVSAQITVDEAKAIALKQAGVTESEAVFTKAKLDYDDGIAKYEIEFIANDTEYEYEIGANSGNILESSAEKIKRTVSTAVSAQITVDEAKSVALKHAGFTADQVKFTKAELDYDDGIEEYEIEFKVNGYEYEYRINVSTGKIIEFVIDD